MKKYVAPIIMFCVLISCNNGMKEKNSELAKNNEQSQDREWVVLFDGASFEHWKGYLSDEVYPEWTLDDGSMKFTRGENGGKNIITKNTYTDFILSLEWKVERGGNSGIFWSVVEDENYPEAYQTGPEVQVLDNDNHDDALYEDGTRTAGSIYDMFAYPKEHVNPANEWNLCVLEIDHKNNIGKVTMNNKETIEFALHGDRWDEVLNNSKFKDWPGFRKQYTGFIGLQDHGDNVWYRNIKIKVID